MTRLLAVDVYGGTLNAQKQYDGDDDVVDRMDEGSIKTSRNVNVTERLFISTCLVFVCYSVER